MTEDVMQESPEGRFAAADKLYEEGKLDEAEVLYRQHVEEAPESARAHHRLGRLQERLQQLEEAEKSYREAFRIQKHAPDINHSLAMLLSRQQRWPEAEYHFRTALAEQPEFYDACLNLGILLQDVHRGIEARHYFKRAIALRPEQALPYQRLGDALKNEDRTSEGLAHLDRYAEIDIALDTLPYNGTTTTCEALWMGVPVVTCVGDRHASRVGLSLLQNANLSGLIGRDEDEFVHIAVTLAGDRERLADMRQNMRERLRGSRLLDSAAMARSLEALWRDLWRRHCEMAPAPMSDETAVTESTELLHLNIGGTERREGWTILDIDEREEVDVVCSVHGLSRYEDASCAEIYCSHVLQCLPIADVMVVLQELHRILVPGGTLYLAVPDLDTLAGLFVRPDIAGEQKFELMRLMFGKQETEHDFHKVGLTYDFLANCAGDVGFSELEHVESFGLFDDGSERRFDDILVSLNLVIKK